MIKLRPIDPKEHELVVQLGAAEQHGIIAPTHIIENGSIVGCLSVGAIPMVLAWVGKQNNAFESGKVFRQVEDSLRFMGQRFIAIPCVQTSPFHTLAEKAGYVKAYENCSVFIKAL